MSHMSVHNTHSLQHMRVRGGGDNTQYYTVSNNAHVRDHVTCNAHVHDHVTCNAHVHDHVTCNAHVRDHVTCNAHVYVTMLCCFILILDAKCMYCYMFRYEGMELH